MSFDFARAIGSAPTSAPPGASSPEVHSRLFDLRVDVVRHELDALAIGEEQLALWAKMSLRQVRMVLETGRRDAHPSATNQTRAAPGVD